MPRLHLILMLHTHLPYVLHHGRWPHGSDWLCEAAIDTYLPLVEVLRRLEGRRTPLGLTVGFTPVLAGQLRHPSFHAELAAYFEQRLAACDEAYVSQAAEGRPLVELVEFWRARLVRLRLLWHEIERDIPGEFRRLANVGLLELTGSAATHGFLPLLGRDESITLQLEVGWREHVRTFGERPYGCWLPECAYRPAGVWDPLPGISRAAERSGLEDFLAESGFRYFFADAHMAHAGRPLGLYGESFAGESERLAEESELATRERSPYAPYLVRRGDPTSGVAVLVRDPVSSMQIWSRHLGYPGAAAYLEFHKLRWPGGLRLWRVSAPGTGLGEKEHYDPEAAMAQAREHAGHFTWLLKQIGARELSRREDAVVVAPFDTELFGHWWFEGPIFLEELFENVAHLAELRPTKAWDYLARNWPRQLLELGAGSWGRGGDYSMWLGEAARWTWPTLWELEERFWETIPEVAGRGTLREVVAQAARELLLLQASDWQFILSTGEVGDYAALRFRQHADDLARLLDVLAAARTGGDVGRGEELAVELRRRDDVFPTVGEALHSVLERYLSRRGT
ncbi:MAG TPA: 1,4-alpha-glucan branching protein domain-containing protein [Gemmatimonadaceae bacterium]|nr:1,4-alpha-glucan branching protein domain-containing protein [Gemmatimonadaceae bacterium]